MADFIGGVTVNIGDGADPEVFTSLGGVTDVSGVGQNNPLVDVTDFDSTAREYIGGLADGTEPSLTVNTDLGDANQNLLLDDVENKRNRTFQIVASDGSQTLTLTFDAVVLGWDFAPSFDNVNQYNLSVKISGAITRTIA